MYPRHEILRLLPDSHGWHASQGRFYPANGGTENTARWEGRYVAGACSNTIERAREMAIRLAQQLGISYFE